MRHPTRNLLLATVVVAATGAVAFAVAAPAGADTAICEKFGSTSIQNGRYIVQNNVWGADTPQCINVTSTGFAVTSANHNKPTNGAPASYPSVYAGCHYGNCSTGSGLPLQVSAFGNLRSTVGISTPDAGEWNAAYDIWLDPTPRANGQNTGAEIMIWMSHRGRPQPIGSRVATVNLEGGTWDVWFGNVGWNVVSYVRTQTTTSLANFSVNAFVNDSVSRGHVQRSWYLTSVQMGFEPWIGGAGLAVNTFSFSTNGSVPTTPPATTPAPTTPAPTTPAPTTPPPGSGACRVTYAVQNQWPGGFVTNVTVTNTSSTSLNGWTVGFTFPGDQRVTNHWSAALTQSGRVVTARNVDYNRVLAPGASTQFGFQGTFGAANPAPTAFTCG